MYDATARRGAAHSAHLKKLLHPTTYTIAFDVASGTDTLHLTLTFTVNGANEAPRITVGAGDAASATITDDTHATTLPAAGGTLSFKDADSADGHSVSVAVKSGPAIGSFAAGVIADTTGSDPANVAGDILWAFAANKAHAQSLAAGESETEVFTVTLHDGQGGSTSQDVAVTVAGVNDKPVIAAADKTETGTVTEQTDTTGSSTLDSAAGGTIHFTDVDLTDTPAASITGQTATALKADGISPLTLTSAQADAIKAAFHIAAEAGNTNNGDVDWTYQIADSTLDFLAAGEKVTLVSTVTVNDNHGGTDTATVTVTITGNNDAPVAVADAASISEDALPNTVNGNVLTNDTDVDVGDNNHVVSAVMKGETSGIDNGTTITATGTYGTLVITKATGGYTYTLANGQANVQALAAGHQVTDVFTYTNSNGGLTSSSTLTVTITGTNDAPTLAAVTGPTYTDTSVSDDFGAVSGTLLGGDVDTGTTLAYGISGGISGSFVVGEASYDVSKAGAYGTLYVNSSSGAYTFVPTDAAINALTASTSEDFTVTVSDGSLPATARTFTVTLNGANDAPVAVADVATVTEDSESNPVSGNVLSNDTDVDTNDTHTVSALSGATDNGTTLTKIGTYGTLLVTKATGAYSYALANGQANVQALADGQQVTDVFTYTNSDGHGGSSQSTLTVTVTGADDSPTAEPVEVSVDTASDTNVMIILDVSGSMSSPSGVSGYATRLDAAKAAIKELLDQYDDRGDVMVRIVTFSGSADFVGETWMSVAAAKAAVDNDDIIFAGGNTNYDAALLTAMDAFDDEGKLNATGTQNVSYFISDGEPTTSSDWPQLAPTQFQNGIQADERGVWESFLTSNDIVSYALGISNPAPSTTALDPIAFNGASNTELASIIVTNLNQLADTLVSTTSSASGSLLSGANSFGGDGGGYVKSITVDGVTYTFDPTANSGAGGITPTGGSGSFTYNGTSKTLTVDTDTGASGGELAVVMTTGAFTFQPTTGFTSESVGFTLTDVDGDTASSTLQLTGNTLPAGIAGSPINLGLTDPAGHVGPVTVTITGIPAGWTLSDGADNGYGVWTVQASNLSTLRITSPDDYAGAMAFKVTMNWTNPDHSVGHIGITDNVEVFPQGAPIFAWAGDDHLSGSGAADLFVFARPIGLDTIYSFDTGQDRIDLIGYAGFANFNDVQRHLSDDNGNAVLALAAGQSITLMGVAAASLTAGNFVFDQTPVLDNAGTMTVGDGALLPLSGMIDNAGTIALDAAARDTHLQLIQNGVTLQGGGQLTLSDSAHNFISGSVPGVTLTNVDNTISGAGQLGAGQMTLVNDGTIVATGFHALVIDTGANVVTNSGTLAATGSGGLIVNSDIANSGLIWAHGGNITINGEVTGSGHAMINGAGTLGFGAASSADVTFAADAAGRLTLEHAADFTGTISGFSSNDQIDLANIGYATASLYNVTYNASTDLTTLVITDGTSTDTIRFAGNYTVHTAWHFSSDSNGGTLLTDSPVDGSAASSAELADTMATAFATPNVNTALADANAATNTQPATATQPDATAQTASAPAAGSAAADTFVFAANFGNVTLANFDPGADVIEIDHTVFADFQELLAAAHDDGSGNAVIAADSHDTITLKNVTVAQLVQHQGDFHFT